MIREGSESVGHVHGDNLAKKPCPVRNPRACPCLRANDPAEVILCSAEHGCPLAREKAAA
ncbi:MAG: hypothetical protein HGB08_01870 [Candidatus Moranbacteria bacterium]|nr:hypothetical protein [Candidatus Moranbacteria bacterium]